MKLESIFFCWYNFLKAYSLSEKEMGFGMDALVAVGRNSFRYATRTCLNLLMTWTIDFHCHRKRLRDLEKMNWGEGDEKRNPKSVSITPTSQQARNNILSNYKTGETMDNES